MRTRIANPCKCCDDAECLEGKTLCASCSDPAEQAIQAEFVEWLREQGNPPCLAGQEKVLEIMRGAK